MAQSPKMKISQENVINLKMDPTPNSEENFQNPKMDPLPKKQKKICYSNFENTKMESLPCKKKVNKQMLHFFGAKIYTSAKIYTWGVGFF